MQKSVFSLVLVFRVTDRLGEDGGEEDVLGCD